MRSIKCVTLVGSPEEERSLGEKLGTRHSDGFDFFQTFFKRIQTMSAAAAWCAVNYFRMEVITWLRTVQVVAEQDREPGENRSLFQRNSQPEIPDTDR